MVIWNFKGETKTITNYPIYFTIQSKLKFLFAILFFFTFALFPHHLMLFNSHGECSKLESD